MSEGLRPGSDVGWGVRGEPGESMGVMVGTVPGLPSAGCLRNPIGDDGEGLWG